MASCEAPDTGRLPPPVKRTSLLTVAFLAGVAPVAAAQAAVVETATVSRSVSVAPDAARSLTLSCPAGFLALSGAARSGFTTLTESFPRSGTRQWTFRFASRGNRHRAGALLRCVRLDLPVGVGGVTLRVGSAFKGDIEVAPGATRRVRVDCPGGQIPTGWGLRRGRAAVSVAAAVPTAGGWVFDLENRGRSRAETTAYVRCLAPVQRARSGQVHRFSIRTRTHVDRGPTRTTSHSCPAGEFSVATGVALSPAQDIFLTATYPDGKRGGRWSFRRAGASSTVETSLLCLDRSTGFRQRRPR